MIKIGLFLSIIKCCAHRKIFKYFKIRYNQDVIDGLNIIHKVRNKMSYTIFIFWKEIIKISLFLSIIDR